MPPARAAAASPATPRRPIGGAPPGPATYWPGSTSTTTPAWFLAAARIIAGPPTSICSIASSKAMPSLATVASNGYRFTATRSIAPIPWRRERLLVRRHVAAGEDPSVDGRVEGLDPSVEHLGESCHLGDLADGQPGGRERSRRAAGRHELDAQLGEAAGQVDQPGLVGNGEKRPADLAHSGYRASAPWVDRRLVAFRPTPARPRELGGDPRRRDGSPRVEAMLLDEDPRRQRVLRVVVEDGHGGLQDDRPGVHALVDEVDGCAGDLDAVLEGLALGVQTGNAGSSAGWTFRIRPGSAGRTRPTGPACTRPGRPTRPRAGPSTSATASSNATRSG